MKTEASHTDLAALKNQCPLPVLMKHLGMERFAVPSCKSPFRNDSKASWGIFQRGGRWYFKDHGNDDSGDEITFLARYLGLDAENDFLALLKIYEAIADRQTDQGDQPGIEAETPVEQLPDATGFGPGDEQQLEQSAKLRGLTVEGLRWAQDRGLLVFGQLSGFEVWGVSDSTGKLIEVRRMEGKDFPASGSSPAHKSHTIRNSQKSWPLGLLEAKDVNRIVLVEGGPDLLAAHCLIAKEQGVEKPVCVPVAMLGSKINIAEGALAHFNGRNVVVYAHADQSGLAGAQQWCDQLKQAGATVKIFDISKVNKLTGAKLKDLNDLAVYLTAEVVAAHPSLKTIMPV